MKRAPLLFLSLMVFLSAVSAQSIESNSESPTAIIVSENDEYGQLIATGPSEDFRIPVIETDPNSLSSNTESQIEANGASKVIIIGGPDSVSTSVESQLEEDYEVVRLWRMTEVGTSVEVSKYFWPGGSDEATVIQQEDGRDIEKLKENLGHEQGPVLISSSGRLSATTLMEVDRVRPEKLYLHSSESSSVKDEISQLDIDEIKTIRNEKKPGYAPQSIETKSYSEWRKNAADSKEMRYSSAKALSEAKKNVRDFSPQEAQFLLVEAEINYNEGNYLDSRDDALHADSKARADRYYHMSSSEKTEESETEIEDLRSAVRSLRLEESKFRQEYFAASNLSDKLEVVAKYREEAE